MMCGLPLAGKSTFYNNTLKDYDHVFISTDHYIEIQCKKTGLTYNQGFDLYIKDACDDLMRNLLIAVKNSKNIIIDQTNLNPKSRKKKLRVIPDFYHKIAVYLPITVEESLKRNNRPGKIIPESVIRSMANSIKIPAKHEGFNEVFLNAQEFKYPLPQLST
jgi:predicted kinase